MAFEARGLPAITDALRCWSVVSFSDTRRDNPEVPRIDSNDDDLHRWVLWHFRYDAARRERRNVEVAAFDNEVEFMWELRRLNAELALRKQMGEAEAVEHVSGVQKEPGHDDRQRRERFERKAGGWRNARVRLRSKRAE